MVSEHLMSTTRFVNWCLPNPLPFTLRNYSDLQPDPVKWALMTGIEISLHKQAWNSLQTLPWNADPQEVSSMWLQ